MSRDVGVARRAIQTECGGDASALKALWAAIERSPFGLDTALWPLSCCGYIWGALP